MPCFRAYGFLTNLWTTTPGSNGENIEVLFRIKIKATEADSLADYEALEEGRPWREWQAPAAMLNAGQIEEVEEEMLWEEGVVYHVQDTYGPFSSKRP